MNGLPIMLACKGPWAALSIEQSTLFGYYCAAAGSVIAVALFRESLRGYRLPWKLTIAVCLLAIHPAWTISAEIGDCGAFREQTSLLVTATYFGLLIHQYFAPKRLS
jgi:hypothetical protein